jgi:protein bicaudal D
MEVDIINNKPPLVDTLTTADNKMELLSLQDDYQRLNEEFLRANEERAKAAEYGLVLLEEKQQLQCKSEELMSLYEISKQELDASSTVSQMILIN